MQILIFAFCAWLFALPSGRAFLLAVLIISVCQTLFGFGWNMGYGANNDFNFWFVFMPLWLVLWGMMRAAR